MVAIQIFIGAEAVTFLVAASIHTGFFITGYQHQAASAGESVIALVLFIALVLTWIRPLYTRLFGLLGQAFAFVGTLVGIFTIAMGIGPRTIPDVTYHVVILAVLVWGLVVAFRTAQSHESSAIRAAR